MFRGPKAMAPPAQICYSRGGGEVECDPMPEDRRKRQGRLEQLGQEVPARRVGQLHLGVPATRRDATPKLSMEDTAIITRLSGHC